MAEETASDEDARWRVSAPNVVGMRVPQAVRAAENLGLDVIGPYRKGGPVITGGFSAKATSQRPAPGSVMRSSTPRFRMALEIWADSKGLAGMREPRRPHPRSLDGDGHGDPGEPQE